MTATASPPRRPLARAGWFLGVLAGAGLVAHGCHGADVDHEPAVALPVRLTSDTHTGGRAMAEPVLEGKLVLGDTNGSGPYVDMLRTRMPEVEAMLKAEGVRHWWVHHITVQLNNNPPLSTIYFGKNHNYDGVRSVFVRHPELDFVEGGR